VKELTEYCDTHVVAEVLGHPSAGDPAEPSAADARR
jgi:hypothetical protein